MGMCVCAVIPPGTELPENDWCVLLILNKTLTSGGNCGLLCKVHFTIRCTTLVLRRRNADTSETRLDRKCLSADLSVALFHETERNRTKPDETERNPTKPDKTEQLLSSNVLQKCIK